MSKFKELEDIELKEEVPELAAKGIHKGYGGTIAKVNGEVCTVWFFNPTNQGEYAFADVHEKHLVHFEIEYHPRLIEEMKEFLTEVKMENYTTLTECDVKEYDVVEVIVEKEKYAKEGVHKGCLGTVMEPYSVEGRWYVIFTNPETGLDIADIEVAREDFKIVYREDR